MQHKIMRRSNVIPAVLLVYLGIMAYIGRGEFQAGHYLYYFGIIGATLACIIALRFFLRRRERLRAEREDDIRRKGR
ncbi:MAG: hypothetical protein K2K40_07670 [Paramuribaculum sp.]|nr:hypothetical protein [Paramuribaculum sp.]MDE6588198.1 hypothetical protein [Paramuribaculum sp.]